MKSGAIDRMLGFAAVMAALSGCGYTPPPVPVRAEPDALAALVGEWAGEYGSSETGRSGTIVFRLEASTDTAKGEVVMVPAGWTPPPALERRDEVWWSPGRRLPEVIPVFFVRAQGSTVSGELASYRDPVCGCTLRTTFTGRLEGDHIEGTFTSIHLEGGGAQGGWWRVERKPSETAADVELEGRGAESPARVTPEGAERISPTAPIGPSPSEMVRHGRALFERLGCSRCHGVGAAGAAGPDLAGAVEHRSFRWIYRMILNPDSMVRADPIARELAARFGRVMPSLEVQPWEALFLYEYLLAEVEEAGPP